MQQFKKISSLLGAGNLLDNIRPRNTKTSNGTRGTVENDNNPFGIMDTDNLH